MWTKSKTRQLKEKYKLLKNKYVVAVAVQNGRPFNKSKREI